MDTLAHRHLTTLTLAVDFAAVVRIGATAAGHRGIAPVTGGSFAGERLNGSVRPGHDWFVARSDGVLVIDVRLTLDTHDGAAIYLTYQGRMTGTNEAMLRFRGGQEMAAGSYSLAIVARFECGEARYGWLNDAIVVGTGAQTPRGPIYTLFEVGTHAG